MHFLLTHLFCRHAAASFDKQQHLDNLVGGLDWHFDLAGHLLSFGDRFRWQAQLLGTESEDTKTWFWGWANPSPGITPSLLQAATALKELGEQRLIDELTEPQLSLEEFNGHFLTLIASGICQANASYYAPYEGGAAHLLIKDDRFPPPTEPPLVRIASLFPQAISAIAIPNHKLALAGYLEYYGLDARAEGDALVVQEEDAPMLKAAFDEHDRLTRLEMNLSITKL